MLCRGKNHQCTSCKGGRRINVQDHEKVREVEHFVHLRADWAQGDEDEDRQCNQGSQADADEPLVVCCRHEAILCCQSAIDRTRQYKRNVLRDLSRTKIISNRDG